MPKGTHNAAPSRLLLILALALALSGLLLLVSACEDLTSDAGTSTTTTTTEQTALDAAVESTSTTAAESAATETPEPTAPDSDSAGGDGDGTDPASSTDDSILTIVSAVIPHLFGNDDNWQHATVGVGENITVRLNFLPGDEVTLVEWNSALPAIANLMGQGQALDDDDEFIVLANGYFRALAPGDTGLVAQAKHEDGSLHLLWRLNLEVVE